MTQSRRSHGGRAEDQRLAEANYERLNKTFYKMEPHAYLHQRWLHLVLAIGNGDGLDRLVREGVHAGRFRYHAGDSDIDRHRRERQRFVIAETEVLTHHVGETLLRLYLAHHEIPPCPWLELARLRSPARFKQAVGKLRERIRSGEEVERIQKAFYGTSDRNELKPPPEEARFTAGTRNIGEFIDFFAATVLDPAPYNTAKHGLALLAENSEMRLETDDEQELVASARGPAIEYLAVRERRGVARWMRETKWINADRALSLITVGCDLVGELWEIGRWRYLDEVPERLRLFDSPTIPEIDRVARKRKQHEGLVDVERVSMSLLYYEDHDDIHE